MDPSHYAPVSILKTEAEPISQCGGAAASQRVVKLLLGTAENGRMAKMLGYFHSSRSHSKLQTHNLTEKVLHRYHLFSSVIIFEIFN
jgi:hypothetical protein